MLFLFSSYFPGSICVASSCRELTENMFARDTAHGLQTVIYSLHRALGFWLGGRSLRFPGPDRVSDHPLEEISRSAGRENSWEENNVSMWMPVKCVNGWESVFSVKSRHNKQWLKAEPSVYDGWKENGILFNFTFYEIQEEYLHSAYIHKTGPAVKPWKHLTSIEDVISAGNHGYYFEWPF